MSAERTLPGRPRWLGFLPAFLFDDREPAWSYMLKAWPLTLVPSMVLSILVGLTMPDAQPPPIEVNGWVTAAMLVLFAPAVETAILGAVMLLLSRFLDPGPAVAVSAAGWGAVHSLAAPIWGLVIWWPFLVMSVAWLTWRHRGLGRAFLVVAGIHALQNSVPAALLLLGPAPA